VERELRGVKHGMNENLELKIIGKEGFVEVVTTNDTKCHYCNLILCATVK
jgi:hypothetical protein